MALDFFPSVGNFWSNTNKLKLLCDFVKLCIWIDSWLTWWFERLIAGLGICSFLKYFCCNNIYAKGHITCYAAALFPYERLGKVAFTLCNLRKKAQCEWTIKYSVQVNKNPHPKFLSHDALGLRSGIREGDLILPGWSFIRGRDLGPYPILQCDALHHEIGTLLWTEWHMTEKLPSDLSTCAYNKNTTTNTRKTIFIS